MPLPPQDAVVALNARFDPKIDWADGWVLPSRRLHRCRIAIIAVAARIDASSSPLLVGGSRGSPVNALLRGWHWLSGLARPSLRKGRGTAPATRPSEEEGGGYELDEVVRGWPIETVVGDDIVGIVGVASVQY